MIRHRLDRIERLESLRADTLDRSRETVDWIAILYREDERIAEKVRHSRLITNESA